MNNFQITIDGPAGSGKSTIASMVAKKINFRHIDTGAMYRAITYEALKRNIKLDNEAGYKFIDDLNLSYENDKMFLNGKDITKEIRSKEVTNNVSTVSKLAIVRSKMVTLQRKVASEGCIVMDGRDIGYHVLPKANLKIFLNASIDVRAMRRFKESNDLSLDEITSEMIRRDYEDENRLISPLKMADDAIFIDTSKLEINDVLNRIIDLIHERKNCMDDYSIKAEDYLFKKVRENDVVEGVVAGVYGDYIEVDINSFAYGKIYLDKFSEDKLTTFKGVVNVGDPVKAVIKKVSDDPTYILMSRLPLIQKEKYYKLKEAFEKHEKIQAKVIKLVDRGLILTYLGNEMFLPNTMIDIEEPVDKEQFLNKTMEVRVITFDERQRKIVASRKDILMDSYRDEKNKQMEDVKVGDIIEGEVVNFQPFGIFIKIGFIQGLLRFSQVTHRQSEKAEDVLKVGDKVMVKVMKKDGTKIDLSRKILLPTPFEEFVKNHKVSNEVRGRLVQKLAFGMIFELSKDVSGLLHKNEYSWNPNDNLANTLKISDELQLAIIAIDHSKERISLSRKALENNPWGRVTLKKGDVTKAIVSEILPGKGIMATADGVDGFISINDLSSSKISKIEDYFSIKDEVEALVIEVNKDEWILKMSIRLIQEKAERAEFEKYMNEQTVDADAKIGDIYKDILKK